MSQRTMPIGDFLRTVFSWCRLRASPADAPWSWTWLATVLGISLVADLGSARVLQVQDNVAARSLLGSGVVLALLWLALHLRGRPGRFVQTGIALVSCATVFSLLMLPVALGVGQPPASAEQLSPLQAMLAWTALAIVLWKLLVDGHILRAALDVRAGLAMVLAAGFSIADWMVGSALLAEAGAG